MWLGRGECDDPLDLSTPSFAETCRTGKDVVRLADLQITVILNIKDKSSKFRVHVLINYYFSRSKLSAVE